MALRRLGEEAAVAALAWQFLTRVPLPVSVSYSEARMAATPRWYPAVGLVLGAILAAALWALGLAFPPVLAALLATALGLVLTGALHEDGFADVCDGLGGGATRARALEIMRDSRIGAFGAAGLGLMLGARILALGALGALAVPALLAGHAMSRAGIVAVLATTPYARSEGLAGGLVGQVSARDVSVAAAWACASVLPLAWVAPVGAIAGVLVLVATQVWMRRRLERRLGGYTGDGLGAVQQVGEVALYLGLLAWT